MRKRIKYLFVFALLLFVPLVSKVSASQIVNVYLFYGDGCPHCAAADKFFDTLNSDSSYSSKYNLVKYEVWHDDENADLMEDVADELDTSVSGVPFIVIGDKYFKGYSASIDSSLKSAIYENYYSSSYKDVVRSIRFSNKADSVKENVEENVTSAIESIFDDINSAYDNNGNYRKTDTVTDKELVAVGVTSIMIVVMISVLIFLSVYAYYAIIFWKVFKKAGRNGWEALIPFYNYWVLFEISGYPGGYSLFVLIPCAGPIIFFIFSIMAGISLAKKFNKPDGFHVLLWLLPIVGYSILAFDDSKYDGSKGEHKNNNNNNNSNSTTVKEEVKEEPKEEVKEEVKTSTKKTTTKKTTTTKKEN